MADYLFEEELDFLVEIASETMITEFKDPGKPLYFKFGSTCDANRRSGILNGRIRVEGYVCHHYILLVFRSEKRGDPGLLKSSRIPFNHW